MTRRHTVVLRGRSRAHGGPADRLREARHGTMRDRDAALRQSGASTKGQSMTNDIRSQHGRIERAPLVIYYSDAYTAAAYGFDTTRKSAWIAESLVERPIAGVEIAEPELLTEAA